MKLIRGRIFTRKNFEKLGTEINEESPFCNNHVEDIDYLFMHYLFTEEIWP